MFRLATCDLKGRRVLLVEDDQQTAETVSPSVFDSGGEVVGVVPTIGDAVARVHSIPVDLVLLHVRYVTRCPVPIRDVFDLLGLEVAFLACFDDWFDLEENDDGQDPRMLGLA